VNAPPPALSVVVVNWNGGAETVANVGALAALARTRGDVEIILVDNTPRDGAADRLEAADVGVRVIRNEINAGFGPACNQGAQAARAGLVLFLNPDARPRQDDDPFGPLIEAARDRRDYDAFAPLLEDATTGAEPQARFQFRRLLTLRAAARELTLLNRLRPHSPALRRERYLDVDRTRPFEVEQPAAAAWVIRRRAFLEAGGFDPRFMPAWFEDVDLAARLLQRGRPTLATPASRFVHRGGSALAADDDTGDERLKARTFRRIFWGNLVRYADKWWGRSGVWSLRALLILGGGLRLVAGAIGPGGAGRPRSERIGAAIGTIEAAFARRRAPDARRA
jgi:GT2 family glycosyltransferase